MEAAIAMWTDWQQRYGPGSIPGEGDESAPSPGLPDDRQGEEADEGGENEEGEEEEPALDDASEWSNMSIYLIDFDHLKKNYVCQLTGA